MMIRSLMITTMIVGLVTSPSAAMAAEGDPGEGDTDATVTVDGRTFGPEDGLVIDPGSGAMSGPLADRSPGGATLHVPTGSLTTYSWGTSYASTQESNLFWYYGKARARANLYNGKRVVAVTIGYSLCNSDGTRYNSPRVTSNASSNGSRWTADSQERVLRVSDNANAPRTCKTRFNTHNATLINPNIY